MGNQENGSEIFHIYPSEVSGAVVGGFMAGDLINPLATIPGFILGAFAGYLLADVSAQQAISKFISQHRPK